MLQSRYRAAVLTVLLAMIASGAPAAESGDPDTGRQLFRVCAACHSLLPGRHMTGPSLASIWGRKAGSVEGFTRYSDALRDAELAWDEHTLDAWLADPRAFIPGNRMTFRGITDASQRRDLIAFLAQVSRATAAGRDGPGRAMPGGMMGGGESLDLKSLEANNRITAITYCGDTYSVTVENGDTYEFWEFNLRFKTDGSADGPAPGHPVIIPAGMRGDRASVVFAAPAEMGSFIESGC